MTLVSSNAQRLSTAQTGIWYAQQLDPKNPIYNTGEFVQINGDLNLELFEQALRAVIGEAESLHAQFHEDQQGLWQTFAPNHDWPLHVIDLRGQANPLARAHEWMQQNLAQPIDLQRDPLFTQALFLIEPQHYLWYQRIHHIAIDAFGLALIERRVAELYTALLNGSDTGRTFASMEQLLAEHEQYQQSEHRLRDRAYWLEHFTDNEHASNLAGRFAPASYGFVRQRNLISHELLEALADQAQQCKANWPELLLAATAIYLYRHTNQREVVLGIPMMGRIGSIAMRVPSMVVNVLPLRLQLAPNLSIQNLVQHVTQQLRSAVRHQRYRYEDLIRDLRLVNEDRRLFGPVINILPFDQELHFGASRASAHNLAAGPVDDLSIAFYKPADGLGLHIDFDANPALYNQAELNTHQARFIHLLEQISANSLQSTIGAIPLLLAHEQQLLQNIWQHSIAPLPQYNIVEKLETQVSHEYFAAIVHQNQQISYAELNQRANQIAHSLREQGVQARDVVAIALPRSSESIAALFGVLKAGATSLMLDLKYPDQRIHDLIEDAQPRIVISIEAQQHRLPDCQILLLDHMRQTALHNPNLPIDPQQAAYLLYTSGSTGKPKGVLVSHQSLANLFESHRRQRMPQARAANNDQRLRIAHMASFAFDASWDPLLWMLEGHELHILSDETILDPSAMLAYIDQQQIDYLDSTPSYIQQLVQHGLFAANRHHPKLIVAGGEAMPAALWNELTSQAGLTVYNLYGPTECTVDTYVWQHDPHSGHTIGSATNNTFVYVLNESLQLVPPGVEGELYIGGAALALGYLNRPDLTAERFVADPFVGDGARMYRTGDLVRYNCHGTLEYLGRADDQIKIRGFRIELGEIIAALESHPAVEQATVVPQTIADDLRLIGYVVAPGSDSHELRAYLQQRLPEYMVPAAIVPLSAMPLTSNGKLNIKALPIPELGSCQSRPAQTALQQQLCDLFAEALGLNEVGIDDNFFDLGGHSLLAARLVLSIRTALNVELSIGALFEHGSVAALSEILGDSPQQGPALIPINRDQDLPISFAQRRLWFLHQLEGPSPTYNLPLVLRLQGDLNIAALQAALHDLLVRHEVLRSLIVEQNGQPVLQVLPIDQVDLPLHQQISSADQLDSDLRNAGRYSFSLANELPLRATLFSLGEQQYALMLLLHHIAGDGWSLSPLALDFAEAYRARCAGTAPTSPIPEIQYADYAAWQNQRLGNESQPSALSQQQLAYWQQALAALPDQLALPYDRSRPLVASYQGEIVPISLSAHTHQRMQQLARETGTTVFMVLQASLASLLKRVGAGDDIPIGAPIAGRNEAALNQLIGFFVNTLVLRSDLSGNPSFRSLLQRIRQSDAQAFAHQDLPFERLVEALKPPRSLARHPLFQTMLAFQQGDRSDLGLPGLRSQLQPLHIGAAKFDLLLNLNEFTQADGSADGISGFLEYSIDLFDHATAQRLAQQFVRLLESALADPDQPISKLTLLSEQERNTLLYEWNNTERELAVETLTSAFAAQVERTPDAEAVVFEQQSLSYAELNRHANQLAHLLQAQGAGPGRIVAVSIPRSLELIIALYAIHKAGAAYVPIDPDYPIERISYMLEDSAPSSVLTTQRIRPTLPEQLAAPVLVLDDPELQAQLAQQPTQNPEIHGLTPRHAAYMIYTSGSTGRPKGVLVPHEGIVNRLRWMQAEYQLSSSDRVLQKTPSSFDVSVWEFFWPLIVGATLVVARPDGHKDPGYLADLIQQQGITTMHFVPSMLQIFLQEPKASQCNSLQRVFCSGEALSAELVAQHYRTLAAPLHNLYGPTEASVDVSYWPCSPITDTISVPIGFPVWNTGLRILDEFLQPVPVGVSGELYLTGVQLALGYHKRPDLTAERFVADPYGPPGSRMYHTGDIARWRADGAVEYLGRADHQVKLRGLRIELGEIEALLTQLDEVAQVAVIAREDRIGDQRLVAYVVPTILAAFDPVKLRRHLAAQLPEFMVPSAFVALELLPLSPSGKLDRKMLPAPDLIVNTDGTPPRTPQETVLRDLFAEILGLPSLGIHDNFFDLGGHSLLVVQLISRIRDTLGVDLSIGSIFQAPTVAGLAELLEVGTSIDALGVLLPLRAQGQRPALFCFHPAGGLSWCYTGLTRQLGKQQPIYGVQARGITADQVLPDLLETMIDEYIAQMLSIQPDGPFRLLGWSTGGLIAHGTATRLQELGYTVDFLCIMDAFPAILMRDLPQSDDIEALEALLIMAGYSLEIMGDQPLDFANVLSVLRGEGSPLANLDQDTIMRLKQIYLNTNQIVRAFDHRVYRGDLLFFRATVETADENLTAATWQPYIDGQIINHEIACSHKDITQPGPLAEIGASIAASLQAIQEPNHVASL
jgi:nonribosomal peptide synthetase DhbF